MYVCLSRWQISCLEHKQNLISFIILLKVHFLQCKKWSLIDLITVGISLERPWRQGKRFVITSVHFQPEEQAFTDSSLSCLNKTARWISAVTSDPPSGEIKIQYHKQFHVKSRLKHNCKGCRFIFSNAFLFFMFEVIVWSSGLSEH